LTNQRSTYALQRSWCARRCRGSARRADAANAFIDLTIAIIVDAVANLAGRPNKSDARHASTSLRALTTLARRVVLQTARSACRNTRRRRNVVINDAVAVVVDAVTQFRLRIVDARLEAATHRDATANRNRLRRCTSLCPYAVSRRGQATGLGRYAVVCDPVAIVVATIANFRRRNTRAATAVLIDCTVAIVIFAVANFSRWASERRTALGLILVDASRTVVVRVVADIARIETKPVCRLRLLRRRGARKERPIPGRITRGNRRRVLG
jgi:hypothetical protein